MRQRIFRTYLGGRGGTVDTLFLSGYNCESVVVSLQKIDAGTTGQIAAINQMLKAFVYDAQILHNDNPNAAYLWLPPDTGATAHEAKTGAAMTVSGPGIAPGNAGATRYLGQYGMLQPSSLALLGSGFSYLVAADNSGLAWSFECWLFVLNRTVTIVYYEGDVGATAFLDVRLDGTGHVLVTQNGVTKWTSPGVVALNTWTHIGLAYNGATIQGFANGVSMGAAVAYTHATTTATARTAWNINAANSLYVALGAVYFSATLAADDFLRHYTDLTTDAIGGPFIQTAATVAKGGSVSVLFTNSAAPGYDNATQTIRMPLSPLLELQNANGIFYVEALFNEYEE